MTRKGTKRKSPCSSETRDILREWATHDDASFHDFSTSEAEDIREALLTWYRENRRKLPWRGDPPPYDGSTAGIATNGSKAKLKAGKNSQQKMEQFFQTKKTDLAKPVESSISSPNEFHEVSPYGVWVSEIMLQQTRVEAVIPYYITWMKSFPTVYHLAAASEEDVNSHWAGLGFYRRARLLHKGAKRVVQEYDGKLPTSVSDLEKIDGIGRYTASAIASIAFDICVPVVDGNVCRVLSRLRGIANNIKAPILKDNLGWKLAEQLVHAGDGSNAGEVNQALMELGATYCAPSGTGTDGRDPLKQFYLSTKLGIAMAQECDIVGNGSCGVLDDYRESTKKSSCRLCMPNGVDNAWRGLSDAVEKAGASSEPSDIGAIGHTVFPLAPPQKAKRDEILAVAVFKDTDERWLLVKRSKGILLEGQWEFPSVCLWNSASDKRRKSRSKNTNAIPCVAKRQRSNALDFFLKELVTVDEGSSDSDCSSIFQVSREDVGSSPLEHVFSHVRHTMWIECGRTPTSKLSQWKACNGREVRWMSENDMKKVGVTAGVKKILRTVKTHVS